MLKFYVKRGDFIVRYVILLLILGAGAFYDVREHRIPNWLVLSGIILGILLEIPGPENPFGGLLFLLRLVIVTGIFFLLFLCRMIGAGDIKLTALICGFLGLRTGALAVGLGFLIGAFWSFIKMAGSGSLFTRLSCLLAFIRHVFQTGKLTIYYDPVRDGYDMVIPLGLCLFLGTLGSVFF
ncbi:prepilin peptidase [Lacrimispora sphenoides]|uniref:Prepilin peptidase CpaA n=1 Tax=Lacrimispora sphenoides JCM 1415 TaxID=1297793 RepID=A0ABY1CHB0_9FIRM|nr:A24 family peptidase [Lacrimispora sphenoides]SEU02922.1 prepilin peptidase CpaA [[Clostridium] sphenoides JCM 1415]SUY48729.1 peptidase A24A prepilin type IV [Lacrimispora sphenoides]